MVSTEVFITCAVTGSGDTVGKSDKVPVTPEQIANDAIEAAKAGAAIAHCHVRDPETGAPARDLHLYREVVERIREADTDVVINLTAGMGGDLIIGDAEAPLPLADSSDMVGASVRTEHVRELLPEICTLDCGTMNFLTVTISWPIHRRCCVPWRHRCRRPVSALKSKSLIQAIWCLPSNWSAKG